MNKAELITRIAKEAKVTRVQASRSIQTITEEISRALKQGKRLTLVGFGTFATSRRKARTGRNPQTGKPIRIAARRVPRFIPGRALKQAVR
jgi:DNA-binding protein HU-beta